MLICGQLMLPDTDQRVRLSPGSLRIEGQRIVEVMEGEVLPAADLGGPDAIICPGFIDAHVHLPQFGIVGAQGLALMDWLEQVTLPAERRWADSAVARADTGQAIGRMLAHGTTGFAAYTTVHAQSTAGAIDVARQAGVRAWIGQALMDRPLPPEALPDLPPDSSPDLLSEAATASGQASARLWRPTQQLIDETAELLTHYPAGGRVAAAVTPRFAPGCSMELMQGVAALAHEHEALIQTHLAETQHESRLVAELFDGPRYAEVYKVAGLLGRRSVLGHGVHLEAQDHALLAHAGSVIAHCPTANRFLMSGEMDWWATRQADVRIALGSDIGAGYAVSMVHVARAMIETAMGLKARSADRPEESVPRAAHAWWQITAGNADALNWPDAGQLMAGNLADLVILDPAQGAWGPVPSLIHDPLVALLWNWDARWIRHIVLCGEIRPFESGRGGLA